MTTAKRFCTAYLQENLPTLQNNHGSPASEFRLKCRSAELTSVTVGAAAGYTQGSLAIVPKEFAFDFLCFHLKNPRPFPLLDVCEPGDPCPRLTAPSADLRTDLPKYWIRKDGTVTETVTDVKKYWRNDLVSFLCGCSYSWDEELKLSGLVPRHMEQGVTVPVYKTTIPLETCGPFAGDMYVTMRPYKPEDLKEVVKITSAYPACHGSPVHIGDPEKIGIKARHDGSMPEPDHGQSVEMRDGEVPVFWACGATIQHVLACAKLPLAITQCPGYMFVTDVLNDQLKC